MVGYWSSRQPFPWTPATHMDWTEGSLRSLEKVVRQSFLTCIYLTYCIAISKLPLLGQTWDKPGLSKTFHWQEGSLLGMNPFPNKLDGAPLLVLGAAVWGCQISGCRETPFSTGPHTLSAPLLSYPAGVGCKSVSVSVRSLNFQQWWFKAQFSHSCSATERSFNMATGPRDMAVTLGVPKGIPGCDRC